MSFSAIIRQNVLLNSRNTFRLPGKAALFAHVASMGDLVDILMDVREMKRFVLGEGSNLIVTGDYDGLILQAGFPGRELVAEDADAWYVRAGAGENWHEFVLWTLARGYPGLENLALIPGTVGATPVQNVGAYGVEIADRFHHLEALDLDTGELCSFDSDSCDFSYRDSVFKKEGWHLSGRFMITQVVFRLPKKWQPANRYGDVAQELDSQGISRAKPIDVANAIIAIRERKLPDPDMIGNAGSFFKNPIIPGNEFSRLIERFPDMPHYIQADGSVKVAAAWLIEQCGWKGRSMGPVGVYDKQALVLINNGGAKGHDVLALAEAIRQDVRTKFALSLEIEPVIL